VNVTLPAILDPFAQGAAATVMTRMALEWLIDEPTFEALFQQEAEAQYTRELTLTHMVDIMLDVASGTRPSPRAAFRARWEQIRVSEAAFYGKLRRMEPDIAAAVVRHTAAQARAVIAAAEGLTDEPIPGYHARVLDGNALAGTEHRIQPLRDLRAAGLPGKLLAVYEPSSGIIEDVILCEDAYTQERALLDRVSIGAGQLWIADRNFCVRWFLRDIERHGAFFLIRRHQKDLPFTPLGELVPVGRCATGEVFEHRIRVEDPEGGEPQVMRRIVLRLDKPTREGETEIELVTNLPAEVSAILICETYRRRWLIEGHFQRLTDLWHCEVATLSYPRAALFAFAMSVVAGNAVALLEGNLRAVHGEEEVAALSHYALVDEIGHTYRGMMIALPPATWSFVRAYDAAALAGVLKEVAAHVRVYWMHKATGGPKKVRTTKQKSGGGSPHVSTRRLLDQSASRRSPPRHSPKQIMSSKSGGSQ
jgi:IS4 transposase